MEAMNCKACRVEIEEAERDESLSALALAHAETCLPCRAFRVERRSLRRLVGSLERVAAPPDFDFRLRARLNAAGSEDRSRFTAWPGFALGRSSLALAAALALVIGAWVIFKQINFNQTNPTGSNEAVATLPKTTPSEPVISAPESTTSANPSIVVDGAAHHNGDAQSSSLTEASGRRAIADGLRERRFNVERKASAPVASDNDSEIRSIDFGGLNPSPQLYPTGIYNPAVDPNPSIIVPVRTLAQPAKFLFGEGRGSSPIFSLRNVTFGSEKLIERSETPGATAAEATDIW